MRSSFVKHTFIRYAMCLLVFCIMYLSGYLSGDNFLTTNEAHAQLTQPAVQSSDQTTTQPNNQPTTQSSDQTTTQPNDQPTTQSSDQSTSEFNTQPAGAVTLAPLITPTSQTPNIPVPAQRMNNCDVCGYCEGSQPPGRWETCAKCVYPGLEGAVASDNKTLIGAPTPDPYHYFTDLGCISTRPGEFAGQVTGFFFSIVGAISFLFFLYGTGVLMMGRGNPDRMNHGRRILLGSIIGLLFALFAVFIVRFISAGLGVPLE